MINGESDNKLPLADLQAEAREEPSPSLLPFPSPLLPFFLPLPSLPSLYLTFSHPSSLTHSFSLVSSDLFPSLTLPLV